MGHAVAEPGSFRDPSGRIYYLGDKVFRTVTPHAAEAFDFVRKSGLLERLASDGRVIGFEVVSPEVLGAAGAEARYVVEHPRLLFVSYPYEWPFPALKAAALLHLDIQLEALDAGIALSDATVYNVQFNGVRPVFIDLLSFRRYEEGELWTGHRQFCEQFLNPLLLRAKLGVVHNHWYRGAQEGIDAADLRRLLPWTSKLSPNVAIHVVAQSALQKSFAADVKDGGALATARLPASAYRRMLRKLRNWIAKLEPADTGRTVWRDYAKRHGYGSEEAAAKRAFIGTFANAVKPGVVWDLGCNTGDYSRVALENGAKRSIGFDYDHGALELAFSRAATENLNLLPLFLDGANPSPDQGWNERERKGLAARANAEAMIALAFIHHIVIGRNIPLDAAVDWLTGLAPQGVIEFVPKLDPMVQRLLALRADIFPDYTEDRFLDCLGKRAQIVEAQTVTESGRKLVWFRR